MKIVALLLLITVMSAGSAAAAPPPPKKKGPNAARVSAAYDAARWYVHALSTGDRVQTGRLDFACQYRLRLTVEKKMYGFPPDEDPVYEQCWERLTRAHAAAIESKDQGMDTIWPGKDALVFFSDNLERYAPSFFVMDRLGVTPPGPGLTFELLDYELLPAASFQIKDSDVLSATATLIRMRVTYRDAITSPVTYAPGAYKFTNTVKRPRKALKAITVQWVVLTGLKRAGFAGDMAVLSLPVAAKTEPGGPIPFVTDTGGAVRDSAVWWEPADVPGLLIASVGRASHFPDLRERVALLNRVLLIDPAQPDALLLLTHDLYDILLASANSLHHVPVGERGLAMTFNEMYWNTYAQTTRMELSLGMDMGGTTAPTPADYLYRLLPAMEKLAQVNPADYVNRLRLGMAYRWNNDQLAAIGVHEALLADLTPKQHALRERTLIELAWSRIARVSWNRTFDDPSIMQAYREAEEAAKIAEDPVHKFLASYTMAYALLFTPSRDNAAILKHLTDAREAYLKISGATPASWRYLLENDNVKGVVEADPAFKPLLAAS
ncbi:MAG TPA: hypothetical protein VFA38_07930 [Nitrospirales bacterium]|nr:hypothetical protein [Nitrospirales bacterium]